MKYVHNPITVQLQLVLDTKDIVALFWYMSIMVLCGLTE